ncbi:MAG TPA: sulfur carrier protein ThiS [Egibacteraceae bacterium]|nr:sulfur carrier protein ThiS [Egibacteraceae bacterium]
MTVVVNGHDRTVSAGTTIADLVRDLGRDPTAPGTAVACNGDVVPRRDWHTTSLIDGDAVEVVVAVGGG